MDKRTEQVEEGDDDANQEEDESSAKKRRRRRDDLRVYATMCGIVALAALVTVAKVLLQKYMQDKGEEEGLGGAAVGSNGSQSVTEEISLL